VRHEATTQGQYTKAFARTLEQEWRTLAVSRRYRQRLRCWASDHEVLDAPDGVALIKAVRWVAEAPALEALAELAVHDDLALRTAIQILLPRLAALAYRCSEQGEDGDEALAQLIELATYFIRTCAPGTAGTPYDFRLWSNIRRAFVRRARAARVAAADESLDALNEEDVDALLVDTTARVGDLDLQGLAEWVADMANVSLDTATLIALTRAGGIVLQDIAEAEGVASDRLRQRRMRAERKLASALSLAS
jgi:DNA-directed RNA polymerase specialized sigma24 family protein